jgi:stearoyl-CoA desaturase (Delta-9 desaturase)
MLSSMVSSAFSSAARSSTPSRHVPKNAYAIREDERVHPLRQIPMVLVHVLPLGALFVDVHWSAWVLCVALYFIRMFGVTAGYHRYFSHRAYKMGRVSQFLMAFLAQTAAQKGVLWWAAHHRHHHRYSDEPEDIHSPKRGFIWSHIQWMLVPKYEPTDWARIKDFSKFPELVFLNKHWWLPPTLLGAVVFFTFGADGLLLGFFLSTALLWHGTFFVNSLAHVWGTRRYATTDTSRNNFWIALLTLGEGWHNNHHHFCASANQGFFWWEVDVSYYLLKLMEKLGLAWDLRKPSKDALTRNRLDRARRDGDEPLLDVGMLNASPADAE